MGTINKQQRMSNILLAGNLYKSHKIDKGLQKIAELQKIAMSQNAKMHQQAGLGKEMIAKQERGNKIAEKQLNIQLTQAQEIQKTKLLKNIFFEISEEVEDVLKEKKITNIEKYFRYGSIKSTLEKNGINIEITDELSEKKLIRDTIKKIENEISKAEKNFTKEDKKDLEEIYQSLEINEEVEIKKLKSSIANDLPEIAKELKKWFTKINKLSKKNKSFLFLYNILLEEPYVEGKDFELNSLHMILGNKALYIKWWNSSLSRKRFTQLEDWEHLRIEEIADEIAEIISDGPKSSLFGKTTSVYDLLNEVDVSDGFGDVAFTVYDKLYKHLKKVFNNPFSKSDYEKYALSKKKIITLKNDIKNEEEAHKKFFTKHPFVKKIISSR